MTPARTSLLFAVCLVFGLSWTTHVNTAHADNLSNLPLPRFASLRFNEVNLRTGPGLRYPIDWVYKRKGLPVEITAEYDIWRRIKDPDGAHGWVRKTDLVGKRTAIIVGENQVLLKKRDMQAPIVAHLEKGAMGHLRSCKQGWCQVKFDRIKGFVRQVSLWGAYPNEEFD